MRLCWPLLIASVLIAQTGCRVFERWDRERDRPTANPASRTRNPDLPRDRNRNEPPAERSGTWPYDVPRDRGTGQPASRQPGAWLEQPTVPRSNVQVPPASTWADPAGKNYDYRAASQRMIAGIVRTPDGQVVENTFVDLEFADPKKNPPGKPVGVQTDRGGYFMIPSLQANETYVLTVRTTLGGRNFLARQFVTVPNDRVELLLREDAVGGTPSSPDFNVLPTDRPASVPTPPGGVLPLPITEFGPPGNTTLPFPAENSGGAYSPVPAPAVRPDLFAPGPTPGFRTVSPPAAIPGGSMLPAPTLEGAGSTSRSVESKFEFRLSDANGKEQAFPSNREGDLLLLSFLSSNCQHSVRAVPALNELHDQFRDQALRVVGIMCDEGLERERTRFAEVFRVDHRLKFDVYLEPTFGKVQDVFRVDGYPTLILLDGTGRKLWQGHPKNASELSRTIQDFIDSRK